MAVSFPQKWLSPWLMAVRSMAVVTVLASMRSIIFFYKQQKEQTDALIYTSNMLLLTKYVEFKITHTTRYYHAHDEQNPTAVTLHALCVLYHICTFQ